MLGIRQDMTYKLLDQAVITDDTGKVIYNLPQQDMLALRVTFRAAFAIAEPGHAAGRGRGHAVPVLGAPERHPVSAHGCGPRRVRSAPVEARGCGSSRR